MIGRSAAMVLCATMAACLVDIPDPPAGPVGGAGGSSQTATSSSAAGGAVSSTASAGGGGAAQGYREEVLADDPVGYWRLNETTFPDAFDESGNGLHGVYVGSAELGAIGAVAGDAAVRFDGGSWVDLGNVLGFEMNARFTLEAWIHPDPSDPDGGFLGKAVYDSGNGYGGWLWVIFNGKLRLHRSAFGAGGDTADTTGLISTRGFTHVVTTYDGITVRHYLNGVMENTAAGNAVIPSIPDPLLIGRVEDWGNFTGVIDEVAIYDEVLPEARIQAHHAAATR